MEAIPCPGHTPGIFCMLIVEDRLLLTGDACHSISYLFFDNALSIEEYRENLYRLYLTGAAGAEKKRQAEEALGKGVR